MGKGQQQKFTIGLRILLAVAVLGTYLALATISGKNHHRQGIPIRRPRRSLLAIIDEEQQQLSKSINGCVPPAIVEFPSDGFTRDQRQSGFVLVHISIACYLFILLAIVCDDFFVPSIKLICEKVDVSKDVAGATFMAAATSSPELFINVIGTFVTEGDLGVGTIVGSAVFNILAVPACCGLFANQVLKVEWWPLTRDSIAYGLTVGLLICTLQDGRIEWYEALILVVSYVMYIIVMYCNSNINYLTSCAVSKYKKRRKVVDEESPLLLKRIVENGAFKFTEDDFDDIVDVTKWPNEQFERLWWIFTWPINVVLLVTIPDCRRRSLKSFYGLTFFMCIVWIATVSYIIAWDITIIGDTFNIPDSVMGLTFLAAGMSVPEAVSSIIVTNQGHGTMGITNSLGSNTFDVLLCLGLPWLVKSVFLPKTPGEHFVEIHSEGLLYSSVSLFSTLVVLYALFCFNSFKLDKRVGVTCLATYGLFLVLASLIELNVFFDVNLPACVRQ